MFGSSLNGRVKNLYAQNYTSKQHSTFSYSFASRKIRHRPSILLFVYIVYGARIANQIAENIRPQEIRNRRKRQSLDQVDKLRAPTTTKSCH